MHDNKLGKFLVLFGFLVSIFATWYCIKQKNIIFLITSACSLNCFLIYLRIRRHLQFLEGMQKYKKMYYILNRRIVDTDGDNIMIVDTLPSPKLHETIVKFEKKFAKYLPTLVFCLFFFGCTNEKIEQEKPVEMPQIQTHEDVDELPATLTTLLRLHNEQRELTGRTGFVIDKYLCDYAQAHAEWMASKNRLQHSTISVLVGKYYFVAENIAWNQKDEKEVVDDWMRSRGHRANILNRQHNKIGFGIQPNASGELYWCTVFAN